MSAHQKQPSPAEFMEAMKNYGLLMNVVAQNSADIAHARRRLYLSYVDEGFTEDQALELCKVLT